MNTSHQGQGRERRRDPRVSNQIPLKICQEDGDIVTETWNVSRSGAYCRVTRYIEPMTKLKIHLLLPSQKNKKQSVKKISCDGVVVRTESVPEKDYYNVAIFFSSIPKKDSELIAEYVNSSLKNPA